MIWYCPDCIAPGLSAEHRRLAGLDVPATDPDAVCADCGARPSEVVRLRLAIERLAHAHAAMPRAEEAVRSDRMTSHEAAGFYRFRSLKALWMATQRHPAKYPHERRGRRMLYIRPAPK
jgi:hypothetical protein